MVNDVLLNNIRQSGNQIVVRHSTVETPLSYGEEITYSSAYGVVTVKLTKEVEISVNGNKFTYPLERF